MHRHGSKDPPYCNFVGKCGCTSILTYIEGAPLPGYPSYDQNIISQEAANCGLGSTVTIGDCSYITSLYEKSKGEKRERKEKRNITVLIMATMFVHPMCTTTPAGSCTLLGPMFQSYGGWCKATFNLNTFFAPV